jgi:hypothetical protein
MFELVLIVCLALGGPESCREERPGYEGSAMGCMTQGQVVAARWIEEHPSMKLARWRCEPPGRRQMPI